MSKLDPADVAFSQYIRLRDRSCQRCGLAVRFNDQGLPISHQASHFQGRIKEPTRFDPLNVDTLCDDCHRHFTNHPQEHYDWQVDRKTQSVVTEIILKSNGYKKKDRESERKYWANKVKGVINVRQ